MNILRVLFCCYFCCLLQPVSSASLIVSLADSDPETLLIEVTNSGPSDVTAAQFLVPVMFSGPGSVGLQIDGLSFRSEFGPQFGGSLETASGFADAPLALPNGGLVEFNSLSGPGGTTLPRGATVPLLSIDLVRAGSAELTATLNSLGHGSGDSGELSFTTFDGGVFRTVAASISTSAGSVTLDALINSSSPADFNSDGHTNGRDYLIWQRGFGIEVNAFRADGDADGDGDVSQDDLAVWRAEYGSFNPIYSLRAIPEPASGVMLGIVMLLSVAMLRR